MLVLERSGTTKLTLVSLRMCGMHGINGRHTKRQQDNSVVWVLGVDTIFALPIGSIQLIELSLPCFHVQNQKDIFHHSAEFLKPLPHFKKTVS